MGAGSTSGFSAFSKPSFGNVCPELRLSGEFASAERLLFQDPVESVMPLPSLDSLGTLDDANPALLLVYFVHGFL